MIGVYCIYVNTVLYVIVQIRKAIWKCKNIDTLILWNVNESVREA